MNSKNVGKMFGESVFIFLLFVFLKISYSFKTKSGKNQENVKQRLVLIYQALLWSKKGEGVKNVKIYSLPFHKTS